MRENIKHITNRHAGKYERRQVREENQIDGADDSQLPDEPNLYALNIKAQLSMDENERSSNVVLQMSTEEEEEDDDE
jgi:hypothetical protein